MRLLGFLLLFLFHGVSAQAYCLGNGIWLLSKNGTLHKNGWLVLEFYGYSRPVISKLNKSRPIYLMNGTEKVSLKILEVLPGKFRETQVVLKAVTELKENHWYELQIDNLTRKDGRLYGGTYDTITNRWSGPLLIVSQINDKSPPKFSTSPQKVRTVYQRYGCGPSSHVVFSMIGKDTSEVCVRARVGKPGKRKTRDYYLPVENGTVYAGHGMCSGPFRFKEKKQYGIRFSLVDQAGNESEISKEIVFSGPERTRVRR